MTATRFDAKAAAKGALLGAVASGVLNVGVYFVASSMGATFRAKVPGSLMGMDTVPFYQPLVATLMAGVVAAGLFAALLKFVPDKAWTIFLAISVLVFLGEFAAPFGAFNEPATILALEVMHLPATLAIVVGIHRFGRVA